MNTRVGRRRTRITLTAVCAVALLLYGVWHVWTSQPRSIHIEHVATLIEHSDPFTVAAFSQNGKYLAISDFKHLRRVPTEVMSWDTENLRSPIGVFDGPQTQCYALSFHPTEAVLAIGGRGGYVKIADVQQQEIVQQFEIRGDSPTAKPMNRWDLRIDLRDVRAMEFSPDGRVLAIATDHREIEIWSTADWQRLHILPRHSIAVNDLAFSVDGAGLLSVGERREAIANTTGLRRLPEIFLWNTNSWEKSREIKLSDWSMTAQHVIFVGESLAVVGNNAGQLTVIDTSTGNVVDQLVGHENMIADLAYDDYRNLLISTSPEQTIVWDMESRSQAATMPGSTFVAYAPKAGLLATAFTYSEKTCVLSRITIDEVPPRAGGSRTKITDRKSIHD